MNTIVITFPGSNCDHDAIYTSELLGNKVSNLWHQERQLPDNSDLVIIPGGFSYGDYLRCGAIARFSNIMQDVIRFANSGGYVIGICNGFQILTECGLLPGALLRNRDLKFICRDVYLKVQNNKTKFTNEYDLNQIIRIPISHGEGNYYTDTIKELEDNDRIVFRYCDVNGNITDEANPNGSISNIAGIINKNGNILGMMPHPERYSDGAIGGRDGAAMFQSIMNILK